MKEQLYLSINKSHPLAKKKSVTFEDLKGLRILLNQNIGFWMEQCESKLSSSDLLVQNSFEAFSELVQASSLPMFNSDRFIEKGYDAAGRISIPITDPEAHATYLLACLASEQKSYRSIFNAVRGNVLMSQD